MTKAIVPTKFVRTKEAVQASVCRDVPPKSSRQKGRRYRPVKVVHYHKVAVKIPDEYAFALEAKYPGKGLQYAVMACIRAHVDPISIEKG